VTQAAQAAAADRASAAPSPVAIASAGGLAAALVAGVWLKAGSKRRRQGDRTAGDR